MPRIEEDWEHSPLIYQLTEYGCGTASLLNAIAYLLPRAEIPPEVVKYIVATCEDKHNGVGDQRGGTSGRALAFLSGWINDYSERTGFPIRSKELAGSDVSLHQKSTLSRAIELGGVAIIGCCLGADHYVLVTGFDTEGGNRRVKLFDPYYDVAPLHNLRGGIPIGVELVDNRPFEYNRLVDDYVFEEPAGTPYSLNAVSGRDAVLLWNADGTSEIADLASWLTE